MYIIANYKETKNGVDINNATLYFFEDDSDLKEVLRFKAATAKGWRSNKAIIADFHFSIDNTELDNPYLIVSNEIANGLITQYKGVEVKIYTDSNSSEAGAWAQITEKYMFDPYDRG